MEILKAEKRTLHFVLMQIEFHLGAGGGNKKSGKALVDCILRRIHEVAVLIHRMSHR